MASEEQALEETKLVRFFLGDEQKRQEYRERFRDRWTSDSHFIRSACQHYMSYLDHQEKKVRR